MLKTDKALYLVETQEDYDSLMIELEKQGCAWGATYNKPTTKNCWSNCKEKTVIEVCDNMIDWAAIDYHFSGDYLDYHFEVYRNNKVKLKSNEKFVADWYEKNKDDFENNLYHLIVNCWAGEVESDFLSWLNDDRNNPIQTLVNIHQFGYEVEKVPLYTVELPNPNGSASFKLLKWGDEVILTKKTKMKSIFDNPIYHLTEDEIKKDFEWAWQFAKEVK